MQIGIFCEIADGETRVPLAPLTVKKFKQKGFDVLIEKDAGHRAGFSNQEYLDQGGQIVDAAKILGADVIISINQLPFSRISQLKKDAWVVVFSNLTKLILPPTPRPESTLLPWSWSPDLLEPNPWMSFRRKQILQATGRSSKPSPSTQNFFR
jgi:hypothetical protein